MTGLPMPAVRKRPAGAAGRAPAPGAGPHKRPAAAAVLKRPTRLKRPAAAPRPAPGKRASADAGTLRAQRGSTFSRSPGKVAAERAELIAEFAQFAADAPTRLTDELRPDYAEAVGAFQRRLLKISESEGFTILGAVATSLLLFSEALADRPALEMPAELRQAALAARRGFLSKRGRQHWDKRRVSGGELLEALRLNGVDSPRLLSVLHRLVSLACGMKHGPVNSELACFSIATTEALRRVDEEGTCCICLAPWGTTNRTLVQSCGHALHTDCFLSLLIGPCSASYRSRCRMCRCIMYWGPLARSNLVCTVSSALAKAMTDNGANSADGLGSDVNISDDDLAELCRRVGGDLRENPQQVFLEVSRECARLRRPLSRRRCAAVTSSLAASSGSEPDPEQD